MGFSTTGDKAEEVSGAGQGEPLQKHALVEPVVEEADDHEKHGKAEEEGEQQAQSGHKAEEATHEEIN